MQKNDILALIHCPIHGYISFVSSRSKRLGDEACEQDLIDHPWVQRLRQIHQLQTAWWVFPAAEHTRFQHVLGVMHLASRAVEALYDSLKETCPDVPSRGYVEALLRVAGLLHDVGHGPFGHFFDEHFLKPYSLTHETLGADIILKELSPIIQKIRRTPRGELLPQEQLDPNQIVFLIVRPQTHVSREENVPLWLRLLRTLFCGYYTVDNMDFVLRDAYMSGYSPKIVDIDRLFYYSFFTPQGLTIEERGLGSLVHFLAARAELFRTIYFHRTVRAVDMTLLDLFQESKKFFFPGNPQKYLEDYLDFTEWSLLVQTTTQWKHSDNQTLRELSEKWRQMVQRHLPWRTVVERTFFYNSPSQERQSLFADSRFFEMKFRAALPEESREMPLRFDLARHASRPGTIGPAENQNFVMDTKTGKIRPVTEEEIVRSLPLISTICRVYARHDADEKILHQAMDKLLGSNGLDEGTNM
ncbi:MAG: HD domain-containing protein [Planctomycetia bacterium]|nr:HD domain-containing protein [Planctomycetia bacterium]